MREFETPALEQPVFLMPSLTAGFRQDLIDAIGSMPASRLVGLSVTGFSPAGTSLIELPVVPAITFDGHVVQGGVVGLLADYAGVSAAACTLPAGWLASTTGYSVQNLAPAKGERLLAVGQALQVGKTHAVSNAQVWALRNGRYVLVASATTNCRPFQFVA